MLLSALSFLVVAQSSSEVLEGLMNNPVFPVLKPHGLDDFPTMSVTVNKITRLMCLTHTTVIAELSRVGSKQHDTSKCNTNNCRTSFSGLPPCN